MLANKHGRLAFIGALMWMALWWGMGQATAAPTLPTIRYNPHTHLLSTTAAGHTTHTFTPAGAIVTLPWGTAESITVQAGPTAWQITPANNGHLQATGHLILDGFTLGQTTHITAERLTLASGRYHTTSPLTIHATTLNLHDTAAAPLQLLSGGDLLLAGEAALHVATLRHPASHIQSSGDLHLRSAAPIVGDAYFMAHGRVVLETPTGDPAPLHSPHDPIILAQGDVSLGAYTGASLHILAGGSVTVTGNIIINASDGANGLHPAHATLFNGVTPLGALAAVPLSNGTTLTMTGHTNPTLDIRAGVDWGQIAGGLPSNQLFGTAAPTHAPLSGASIRTQNITISAADGRVLLTNRYLTRVGAVGDITTGTISTNQTANLAHASAVFVDSLGTLTTSTINTQALSAGDSGRGGAVWLAAVGDVAVLGNLNTGTNVGNGFLSGPSGAVWAYSAVGNLRFTGNIDTDLVETGANTRTDSPVGDITLHAPHGGIEVMGTVISARNNNTTVGAGLTGPAGNITLQASTGLTLTAATLYADHNGRGASTGGGGRVQLTTATGDIRLVGILAYSINYTGNTFPSQPITLQTGGGGITISNNAGNALNSYSQSYGGNIPASAGAVIITATQGITVAGQINSYTNANQTSTPVTATVTNGGGITLTTSTGDVTVGGRLLTTADAKQAGGASGPVWISAPLGRITLGNTVDTGTFGGLLAGRGGDVTLAAGQDVALANSVTTGPNVNDGGTTADAGHILISSTTGNITLANTLNSEISEAGIGTNVGQGGNIVLSAPQGSITQSAGSIQSRTTVGTTGAGLIGGAGNITLTAATGIAVRQLNSEHNTGGRSAGGAGHITLFSASGPVSLIYAYARDFALQDHALGSGRISLTAANGPVIVSDTGANALNNYTESRGGSAVAVGGAVVVSATQGITVAGQINSYALANNAANPLTATVQGSGSLTLTTSAGDIRVGGRIYPIAQARLATGPAGSVWINAPLGRITLGAETNTSTFGGTAAGRGGDITLVAGLGIQTANYVQSSSNTNDGGTTGDSGHIVLTSAVGHVVLNGYVRTEISETGAGTNSGNAGNITIQAPAGAITLTSASYPVLSSRNIINTVGAGLAGSAGDIALTAATGVAIIRTGDGNNTILSEQYSRGLGAGDAGDVSVVTTSGDIALRGIFAESYSEQGDSGAGGHILLSTGAGQIAISGTANNTLRSYTQATVGTAAGHAGNITLLATGNVNVAGEVNAYATAVAGTQNGGGILIQAGGSVSLGEEVRTYSRGGSSAGASGPISITAATGTLNTGLVEADALGATQAGPTGAIQFTAMGNITLGNNLYNQAEVDTNGQTFSTGDINLTSQQGDVSVNGFVQTAIATTGVAGLTAATGDIVLLAPNGRITTADYLSTRTSNYTVGSAAVGQAGQVWLEAAGDIIVGDGTGYVYTQHSASGGSAGASGNITLLSDHGHIAAGSLYASSFTRTGPNFGAGRIVVATGDGAVSLETVQSIAQAIQQGVDLPTGSIGITATQGITVAGQVRTLAAAGNPNTNQPSASTAATGDIHLFTSGGNVVVSGSIATYSEARATAGPAGQVSITAATGAIQTGAITTDGRAEGMAGGAGDVTLTASGAIVVGQISGIAHNAAVQGSGGVVQIAGQPVRLTSGGVDVRGLASTGGITITHGGGGLVPFVVGSAAVNGAASGLQTAEANLLPNQSFLYDTFIAPNIWLVAVPAPSLSLTKSVTPTAMPVAGGTVTYTVVLQNTGGSVANQISVQDVWPTAVVFGAWVVQPVGASHTAQSLNWAGDVAAGEVITVAWTAVHVGVPGDVVTNTAQALLPDAQVAAEATAVFHVWDLPEVVLDTTLLDFGGVGVGLGGQPLSVTVSNPAGERLPLEVALSSAPPFAIAATDCPASLPSGTSCTVALNFWPTAALSYAGALTITSNAAASPAVVNLLGVGLPVDVGIGQDVGPSTAVAGQPITYTLAFSNSTGIATGVTISYSVPVWLANVAISHAGAVLTQTSGTPALAWQVADLPPGAGGVITLTAVVPAGWVTPTVATSTAEIGAAEEQNLANNVATAALTVAVPQVSWQLSEIVVSEGAGTAVLSITLDQPQPYLPVTVAVQSSDETASAGADYSPISQTVSFAPGQTAATVTIALVEDTAAEGNESLLLTLSAPQQALLAGPANARVTIVDNDAPGLVLTPTTSLVTTEAGGTAVVWVGVASEPSAVVTVTLTGLDATEHSISQTVWVLSAANNWSQALTFVGVDDGEVDGDISVGVMVALSSADGAYDGLTAVLTLTNVDDDSPVVEPPAPRLFLPFVARP